jgi:hypothetical protein
MWAADPTVLCRQHLLGEHVEMHMFVGHLARGARLGAYATLCETWRIKSRHEELVAEMLHRGYSHNSPLEYEDQLHQGKLADDSLAELRRRCPKCNWRYVNVYQAALAWHAMTGE